MHRIALRFGHVQSKIHQQAWSIPATRATWLSRQPFAYCRRQFHASAPKRSESAIPTELIETIKSTGPLELLQSVSPAYLFLPLAVILPHYLRHLLDIRAKKKNTETLSVGAPLEIVYVAVRNRRVLAMTGNASSTKLSREYLQSDAKLNSDFASRINGKYAEPYYTWRQRTLIPPALHLAWTTVMVTALDPKAGGASLDLSTLPLLSAAPTVAQLVGHAIIIISFMRYLRSIMFWQSFPSHHVDRMHPWLKSLYGLNTVVSDERRHTVTPYWWSHSRSLMESSFNIDDFQKEVRQRRNATVVVFAMPVITLFMCLLVHLSFLQGFYLLMGCFAAIFRERAYDRYVKQLQTKIYRSRCKWVPLTPYF